MTKRELAKKWVNGYTVAGAAAVIAAIIPGSTSVLLMGIEARMCLHIGMIYRGSNYSWKEALAASGAVGLACVAGKLVALEALNLIPFAGWAAKSVVAGTVIKTLGEAIIQYYESNS